MKYKKENGRKRRMTVRFRAGAVAAAFTVVALTGCAGPEQKLQEAGGTAGTQQEANGTPETQQEEQEKQEIILPMQAGNGMWGYVNLDGDMVIFPKYDEAGAFNQDGMAYVRSGETAGYIDRSGNWALGPRELDDYFRFDRIETIRVNKKAVAEADLENMEPHIFAVCGKLGTVGIDGKVIIPFQYDTLLECINTEERIYVASVSGEGEDEKYGILDENGNILTPLECDYIYNDASGGRIIFEKDNTSGFLGVDGHVAIEPEYDDVWFFYDEKCAVVQKDGLYGLIDRNNTIIVPAEYEDFDVLWYPDDLEDQEEDPQKWDMIYSFVDAEGRLFLYNATLGEFLPGDYEMIDQYESENDFIVVSKSGEKYGVINNQGEVLIDFQYSGIDVLDDDGMLSARLTNGKCGLLNTKGERKGKFKYDYIGYFTESGLAHAEMDGRTGFLNRDGEEVIPFKYDTFVWFDEFPELGIGSLEEQLAEKLKDTGRLLDLKSLGLGYRSDALDYYNHDGKLLYTLKMPKSAGDMTPEEYDQYCVESLMGVLKSLGFDGELTLEELSEIFYSAGEDTWYVVDEAEGAVLYYDYSINKFGFKDENGEKLTETVYDEINMTDVEGIYITGNYRDDDYQYLSGAVCVENGKIYEIPSGYDEIEVLEDKVIAASKNNTTVLLNRFGNWIMRLDQVEAPETLEDRQETEEETNPATTEKAEQEPGQETNEKSN